LNMNTPTEIIIKALRILVNDIQSPDGVPNACVAQAADRLEELQRLNESMQVDRDLWIKVGREKLEAVERERDEARAEVERIRKASNKHHLRERDDFDGSFKQLYAKIDPLKQALHEARLENSGLAAQLERTRPDPSRLEIAAIIYAGQQFKSTEIALTTADNLIAAAKGAK